MLKIYAPDPFRPRVRVLITADGTTLEHPYDVDLWDAAEGQPTSVEAPLDPAEYGIDPLVHLS